MKSNFRRLIINHTSLCVCIVKLWQKISADFRKKCVLLSMMIIQLWGGVGLRWRVFTQQDAFLFVFIPFFKDLSAQHFCLFVFLFNLPVERKSLESAAEAWA